MVTVRLAGVEYRWVLEDGSNRPGQSDNRRVTTSCAPNWRMMRHYSDM
jgi:hypothetical protein